jgi:hypothetical protein
MDINAIRAKLNALQTQQSRPSGEARKNVFWKPAVGKQTIRIVPSKYNKSNPFSELYFHYGIDKNPIISPTNWGEKDPIVEFAKQLRQSKDKESWRLAKKLDPKMRVFVPIIVRGEEADGVKLWGFGKEIYMELLSMVEDEDIGDYTDIVAGRDLNLTTVGADVTGTNFNKTTVRARTKQSPLAEDEAMLKALLDDQPDPLKAFSRMSFDDMKSVLQKWLAPEEEEGVISSEPAANFDDEAAAPKAATPATPAANFEWKAPQETKFTLETQGKKVESKADKFESLFSDDDDLPF